MPVIHRRAILLMLPVASALFRAAAPRHYEPRTEKTKALEATIQVQEVIALDDGTGKDC